MFVSAFYSIIIPSCLLWGILALLIQYFVDKYLFLRKRNNRFNLGQELGNEMVIKYIIFLRLNNLNMFYLFILYQI